MKKLWLAVGLSIICISGRSYAASSDYGPGVSKWHQDDSGWWYRNADGSYPASVWAYIGGEWYYFDENGYMRTGMFDDNGTVYLLNDDGAMIHDQELEINGILYRFGPDGAASIEYQHKAPFVMPREEDKTDLMRANDAMADQILARITNESMSDRQKAVAIYNWIRGSMTYSAGANSAIGDWAGSANEGLRRRRGHCYTYYATALTLLSRAGIPSIEVIRSSDSNHWWNLVYIEGNWYHFDTTPRRVGGNFCLLTTGQLMDYSRRNGNSHTFDQSQYPTTP